MKLLIIASTLFATLCLAAADKKRCFCKAVASDNHGQVIHDFGTIEEHTNWLHVGCKRLHGCSSKCDQKVKEWVCNHKEECKRKTAGKHVLPYYTASVCGKGAGNNARACECEASKTKTCQLKCVSQRLNMSIRDFMNCLNRCMGIFRTSGISSLTALSHAAI